jgi:hypothetical protein
MRPFGFLRQCFVKRINALRTMLRLHISVKNGGLPYHPPFLFFSGAEQDDKNSGSILLPHHFFEFRRPLGKSCVMAEAAAIQFNWAPDNG